MTIFSIFWGNFLETQMYLLEKNCLFQHSSLFFMKNTFSFGTFSFKLAQAQRALDFLEGIGPQKLHFSGVGKCTAEMWLGGVRTYLGNIYLWIGVRNLLHIETFQTFTVTGIFEAQVRLRCYLLPQNWWKSVNFLPVYHLWEQFAHFNFLQD